MITEKKLNNIEKLELEDVKQILYKCLLVLGVEDIENARGIFGVNRSRIYQMMIDKNTLQIGKHKFLMTNFIIKNKFKQK
jgi:hypothetical protein